LTKKTDKVYNIYQDTSKDHYLLKKITRNSAQKEGTMKKIALLLSALLFSGIFSLPVFSADKTLPLATLEVPPFNYVKDGKPAGASVEFVQELFSRMGYKTTVDLLPFKRGKVLTARGEYAGLFTIVKSPERLEDYYYPDPITVNRNVFFKRTEDDLHWDTMEDLKNYRFGMTEGYSYPPILQTAIDNGLFKTIDKIANEKPEILQLRKLVKKRIDFFMVEVGAGLFYKNLYAPEFDSVDYNPKPVGPMKNWYFVFSKKWPDAEKLVQEFNAELAKMISEGRQDAIYGKYGVKWSKDDVTVDW